MPGINIIQQPKDFSPIYSPADIVVNETGSLATTENFFEYTAKLYASSSIIGTLKSLPDLDTDYGVFNISDILQGYVQETFNYEDEIFSASHSIADVDFEFGWQYVSASGDFVQVTASATSSRNFFNGGLEYQDFIQFQASSSSNEYLLSLGSTDCKPLKTQALSLTKPSTRQWVYYMAEQQEAARYVYFETFDSASNSIGVYRKTVPAGLQNNNSLKMFGAQVGKNYLVNNQPSDVSGEAGMFSTSSVDYYEVWVADSTATRTSQKHKFDLVDECSMWDLYHVYYLNRLGGIDSFSFHGRSVVDTDIQRNTYRREDYNLSTSGISYSRQNSRIKNYYTTYSETLQLNTEFIQQERHNELKDLKTAPIVWVEYPNGSIVAGSVVDNSFRQASRNNNEVIALRLRIRIEENNIRQKT